MDEKAIREEIQILIYDLGFIPYHPPDMKPIWDKGEDGKVHVNDEAVKKEKKKRSMTRIDIVGLNPVGPGILIECKKIDLEMVNEKENGRFYFRDISKAQRESLDRWAFGFNGDAFIGIGTTGGKWRRLWIVPWKVWVEAEKSVMSSGGKGMPVYSTKGLGIMDLFKYFELKWIGTGQDCHWSLPDWHPMQSIQRWCPRPENEYQIFSERFE